MDYARVFWCSAPLAVESKSNGESRKMPTRPTYPTGRSYAGNVQSQENSVVATVRSIVQHPRRGLVLRLALAAAASFVAVQVVTVAALVAVDSQRKRRHSPPESFPHNELPPVSQGENDLEVYTYGEDLYSAMLTAIDAAEDSIFLETYIWKSDEFGQRFKDHLIRKAEQGVQVYCIFDEVGNLVVPQSFKQFPSSVHVLRYFPFRRPRHLLDPRRYALDHRKLLIVDDRIAFIGGYNLGQLYATEWRDTHLRITGPSTVRLAQAFVDFWNRNAPESTRIYRRYPRGFDTELMVRGTDALRLAFPIRDMYLNGIENAEHHILLTSAYFIPDHSLLESLKAAAARGVDVQVLVPWTSNHIVADWASHAYFMECLQAGIRIFGYQHAMIHAKTCTADGCITTIGTANLDRLSMVGNYEINVAIYSEDLAAEMEKIFAADKTNAFELTLQDWESRPWYIKMSEQIIKRLRFVL
jgi:cardiolipin synthase